MTKKIESMPDSYNIEKELHNFIFHNTEQFFKIIERMIIEVENKKKYPKNCNEMVAMTMFSTLQ